MSDEKPDTEENKDAESPAPEKEEAAAVKASEASSEALEKAEASDEAKAEKKEEKKEETAADLLKSDLGEIKVRRAKGSKNITSGVVNILATFNNTKVTFCDEKGNVISWSSAGKCNFRGSRKSTAYAAQIVTQDAGRTAISHGMKDVVVKVRGPGMGRDSAIRALQSLGLNVSAIIDVTPVPHNGCRPPKRRRV